MIFETFYRVFSGMRSEMCLNLDKRSNRNPVTIKAGAFLVIPLKAVGFHRSQESWCSSSSSSPGPSGETPAYWTG